MPGNCNFQPNWVEKEEYKHWLQSGGGAGYQNYYFLPINKMESLEISRSTHVSNLKFSSATLAKTY